VTSHLGLTDEQHAMRRERIGASEVASIMGLSPWRTPYDVWRQKTEPAAGREPLSEPAEWGLRLEPVIIARYLEARPGAVAESPGTVMHEDSRLCCTPDAVITLADGTRRGLQVKTAGVHARGEWGDAGTDQVPPHYWWQVQAEMLVTGLPVTDLVVLIGGQEYREFIVLADEHAAGIILDASERFWARVETWDAPPTPLEHRRALDELRERLAQTSEDIEQVEDEHLSAVVDEYQEARAIIEDLQRRQDALQARILQRIGGLQGIDVGRWRCTWREVSSRGRVDWEAVARRMAAEDGTLDEVLTRMADETRGEPRVSRRLTIKDRGVKA